MHVGESTIQARFSGRKKTRAASARNRFRNTLLNAQKYDEHDEFIGWQAIAETLHLPESVVSASCRTQTRDAIDHRHLRASAAAWWLDATISATEHEWEPDATLKNPRAT